MTREKTLVECKSATSRPRRRRFYFTILFAVAIVACSVLVLRGFLSGGTAAPLSAVSGTGINAVAPMQSPTPVLMKEYIYAEGRLVATATGSATAYEADVTVRPAGSGTVTVADWTMAGRFAAGLETPPGVGSEFQRADCAPRETLGNGQVSLADWVQAGRYSAGNDPLTAAGGPTAPSGGGGGFAGPMAMRVASRIDNEVRASSAEFKRGEIGALPVEIDTRGDENALSFSITYEPGKVTFLDAVIVESGGKEVHMLVNDRSAAEGRIAIALALLPGQAFSAGTHRLIALRFVPARGTGTATMQVKFDDNVIAREMVTVDAKELPKPRYQDATVTITDAAK
jgi:hypothetical protein